MTNIEQLGKIPKNCAVGKNELLAWVNSICGVNYHKIEDCSNGAAFCQIMDAIYPDSIALGKVNYDPVYESDIVNNFIILQESFNENKIQKNLNINELVRKKASATLEMMQWLYNYCSIYGCVDNYDPYERRKIFNCKEPNVTRNSGVPVLSRRKSERTISSPTIHRRKTLDSNQSAQQSLSESDSEKKVRKLEKSVTRLENELMATTKERQFYWEKLRDIEIYCNENQNESTKQILELLYRLDADGEFIQPDEN